MCSSKFYTHSQTYMHVLYKFICLSTSVGQTSPPPSPSSPPSLVRIRYCCCFFHSCYCSPLCFTSHFVFHLFTYFEVKLNVYFSPWFLCLSVCLLVCLCVQFLLYFNLIRWRCRRRRRHCCDRRCHCCRCHCCCVHTTTLYIQYNNNNGKCVLLRYIV